MKKTWCFTGLIILLIIFINVNAAQTTSANATTSADDMISADDMSLADDTTDDTAAADDMTLADATTLADDTSANSASSISDIDIKLLTKSDDSIGSYEDVVKHLQNEQIPGSPYEKCLQSMKHACSAINKPLSLLPVEEQDDAVVEMIDACFEQISFDCAVKFAIVRTGDLMQCHDACNITREADVVHCQAAYVGFSKEWELCKNNAVITGQRCYRSCAVQFLPSAIKNIPLTTDPFGIGTDEQKLISVYRLLGSPLPSGCNW